MVQVKKKSKKDNLIRLIHVGKTKVELSDSEYRHLLYSTTGKSSSLAMNLSELEAVLKAIKGLGFKVKTMPVKPEDVGRASFEQINYIKGLWELSARVKTEAALNAFVKKITGVPFLGWLDKKDAQKVILAVREIAANAGYNPDGII
ncbi:regulatory protein GemA [Treponema denticola]|uniref:regulatory protein GemA n=1 Tax=Treponema denticola TaxID=158 RepID=UPI0020A39827|nr:regulatory protein GemA [Treponema denticola]UTC87886.1 regulatory protein GemA [Treponema denticola]